MVEGGGGYATIAILSLRTRRAAFSGEGQLPPLEICSVTLTCEFASPGTPVKFC
jgi:hypothetical protein